MFVLIGKKISLLVSDVADLRNIVLMKERRVTSLTKDLHVAKTSLDQYKRELSHRQEFDHLVREVAASGESYMSLMRGVRSFIRPSKGDSGAVGRFVFAVFQ